MAIPQPFSHSCGSINTILLYYWQLDKSLLRINDF